MNYLQQDLAYFGLCAVLTVGFPIFLAARGLLAGGRAAVLLVLLLTIAGAADLAFKDNSSTALVLLADGVNVFCFLFCQALFLHFSFAYFFPGPLRGRRWLYLLPLALALLYFFSPWLVSGIVRNAYLGFRLNYAPGFWLLPLFGALAGGLALALNFAVLFLHREPAAKDRAIALLLVMFLALFFFSASLIIPFLAGTVNFASPLPVLLALLVIVYTCARYGFFLME
jgi:hypothetical protein